MGRCREARSEAGNGLTPWGIPACIVVLMTLIAPESVEKEIVAIDLDDLTLGRLKMAARGSGLSIKPVVPEGAIEHVRTRVGPFVVMLEWREEEEEERRRLCRALRAAAGASKCHIVALGGMADHAALERAMEEAADDVLCRPFGAEVLLRLRRAVHAAQSSNGVITPRAALDEALASVPGGEVVVRSGRVVAVIHVQDGYIVWANLSSMPAAMEDVTRSAGVHLDAETISAVKQECRAKGTHFMDVLVAWGTIERDRAREAVREFVAERVKLVLELPEASALFLPKARIHSERLRFSANEIPSLRPSSIVPSGDISSFDAPAPSSRSFGNVPVENVAWSFNEAAKLEGVLSVAVLERKTGASVFATSGELDTGIAWSQLGTLAALGREADDVLACAGDRCFVTRVLRAAPSLALFVVLSLSATTVGLARSSVAQVAAGRGAALS